MTKLSSVERYKQIASFEAVRKTLLEPRFADRLERPLAYWALAADRRLPLAFLGRTLRELVNSSFDELQAAPGIGRKKMAALVKLLQRATKEQVAAEQFSDEPAQAESGKSSRQTDFNSGMVSEALWEQWRHTVQRHGLGSEKLGRLAPSLQALPTVIWEAPLSNYLDYSVAEIQQLKTHGEKRVRVILQVFHAVHEILGQARTASHLTVRMAPKFVLPIETWMIDCIAQPDLCRVHALREVVAKPLVQQIQNDCGPVIAKLAEGRLGLNSAIQTVRAQSKKMNVTRARIYQLLEQAEQAMKVRWPEGRGLLVAFAQKLAVHDLPKEESELLAAITELFFPDEEAKTREKKSEVAEAE
jgi:hypothetical protein